MYNGDIIFALIHQESVLGLHESFVVLLKERHRALAVAGRSLRRVGCSGSGIRGARRRDLDREGSCARVVLVGAGGLGAGVVRTVTPLRVPALAPLGISAAAIS